MSDNEVVFKVQIAASSKKLPLKPYNFKGLKEGDHWCLCASRWQEAFEAGKAPKVVLKSTNIATISVVKLEDLKKYTA